MAFYPNYPPATAIYAYPVPFPNGQDFYAVYPEGNGIPAGNVYYDSSPGFRSPATLSPESRKLGYNTRKVSMDSGISDYPHGPASRKTSNTSVISDPSSHDDMASDDAKEDVPMVDPDDDLCESIVAQVEFYFSDANITKDKFLLKHVKRNKEGFVSLKLVSSFKRVKHLTKDWRQVAVAIERKSKRLEINDLKTKVRRTDPLPEYDETTPSRTVVAQDLPLERPTIEGVAELFSACGEIALIRILRPGNPIPADVKSFSNKNPEMTAKVCALIEFERTEYALKAVRDLSKDGGMKVMELTAPSPKKANKDTKKSNFVPLLRPQPAGPTQVQPQRRFSYAGLVTAPRNNPPPHGAVCDNSPRRKISLFSNVKFDNMKIVEEKKDCGLNPNAPSFSMQHPPQQHVQHRRSFCGRPPHAFIEQRSVMEPSGMMMQPLLVSQAPAPVRRLSAVASGQAELAASGLSLPPNVIRLPRGPSDKGKGFQRWCKDRMLSSPAPVQRKSRAIPIVAPGDQDKPEGHPEPAPAPEGAPISMPIIVVHDSDTADEGHFSDPDTNERTR